MFKRKIVFKLIHLEGFKISLSPTNARSFIFVYSTAQILSICMRMLSADIFNNFDDHQQSREVRVFRDNLLLDDIGSQTGINLHPFLNTVSRRNVFIKRSANQLQKWRREDREESKDEMEGGFKILSLASLLSI